MVHRSPRYPNFYGRSPEYIHAENIDGIPGKANQSQVSTVNSLRSAPEPVCSCDKSGPRPSDYRAYPGSNHDNLFQLQGSDEAYP
jgi:hypothetical protein